jgi:hypothetical protein
LGIFQKYIVMTPRQSAILDYHSDLAAFATDPKHPVFVILDLEDSVGFEIASHLQANCADKRDASRDNGAYPAFTLALPLKDANAMLAHGWPNARQISNVPEGMIPVILVSEGRCLTVLLPRG